MQAAQAQHRPTRLKASPAAMSSVDAHHAADAFTGTTVALMSYNIGIINNEIQNSNKWAQKYMKIRDDVKSAFNHDTGIQVLLISEFGNVFNSIDEILPYSGVPLTRPRPTRDGTYSATVYCTRELFENLLADIDLPHIHVVADAPYVALIDSQCWRVKLREVLDSVCTNKDVKVQHLILEHVDTSEPLRCFNVYIPSTVGTKKRKEDCVKTLCYIAIGTGVQQPTVCMPWIIAGDLNLSLIHI